MRISGLFRSARRTEVRSAKRRVPFASNAAARRFKSALGARSARRSSRRVAPVPAEPTRISGFSRAASRLGLKPRGILMLPGVGIDTIPFAHRGIASLTDDEVQLIAGKIDDLSAGGGVEIFALIILAFIIATVLIFKFTSITDLFP